MLPMRAIGYHAGKIDPDTWAKRIAAREPYRLPRKGKPDEEGHQR
jgi:hypothetical protein